MLEKVTHSSMCAVELFVYGTLELAARVFFVKCLGNITHTANLLYWSQMSIWANNSAQPGPLNQPSQSIGVRIVPS